MSVVGLVCFLISLCIIGSSFRRDADVLSPARVFAFVWSLTIGLAELKLSRLQHEWSLESWAVLLTGPLSFLVGIFVIYSLNLPARLTPIAELRQSWRSHQIDERKLFHVVGVLFATFVLAYVAIILAGREIPLFSAEPGRARLKFQMFGVGLLIHNVLLIVYFSVVYGLVVQGNRRAKYLLLLMSIVSALLYSITLQRFPIVVTILLVISVLYYASRHLRFVTVALFFLFVLAFVYGVSTLRMSVALSYFVYVTSQMKVPPEYALLTEPYMYIVTCVENFARAISRLDHHTFGYYTFDFVGAVTGLKHWVREYFGIIDYPYLISGYNTYTAFWTYYRDFGVLGLFGIGFMGGLLVGIVYHAFRRKPTLFNLTGYSIAVFLMTMSFFNSQTGFLWFIYNVLLLFLILHLVTVRQFAGRDSHTETTALKGGTGRR